MLTKVKQFIEQNNLIDPTKHIIVAVSGGVDSICLLYMLQQLSYKVVLAHVNHHKREASEEEAIFLKKWSTQLRIPFEKLDYHDMHTHNFHDAAHNARYTFFKELAVKYNTTTIATAHHLDDQLETVLIKLMNGSNLYGYGGISVQLTEKGFDIIRPLLCLSKQDLYLFAKKEKLSFFEDDSNASDVYLRNRVRHHIVPLLKTEEPAILQKTQEYSTQVKEAFAFIRKFSIKYLNDTQNRIRVSTYLSLDIAVQKDILCLMFEMAGLDKNTATILKCHHLVLNAKGNKKLDIKNGFSFIIEYDKAYIQKQAKIESFEEILTLENEVLLLGKYRFYFSKKLPQSNAKHINLCYNILKLPFLIRNKQDGDFIKMSYGNKKVGRLMIDAKLSMSERKTTPLIFDQEGNLLWVYPFAKSKLVQEQKSSGNIFLICEEISNEQ